MDKYSTRRGEAQDIVLFLFLDILRNTDLTGSGMNRQVSTSGRRDILAFQVNRRRSKGPLTGPGQSQ